MAEMTFWYSIGSTYSYLTVMRIDAYAAARGVRVEWRPFNVRWLMTEQNNIPFKGKPAKSAYMWRDIERRARKYGLPATIPAPYPLENLVLANQVALLGMQEGWGRAYTRAAYQAWFVDGQPAGSEPNLSQSIAAAGQDPGRVIPEAQGKAVQDALARQSRKAMELGIFGVPSFVVGDEVFWGDDRLEDAADWALTGKLGA